VIFYADSANVATAVSTWVCATISIVVQANLKVFRNRGRGLNRLGRSDR